MVSVFTSCAISSILPSSRVLFSSRSLLNKVKGCCLLLQMHISTFKLINERAVTKWASLRNRSCICVDVRGC